MALLNTDLISLNGDPKFGRSGVSGESNRPVNLFARESIACFSSMCHLATGAGMTGTCALSITGDRWPYILGSFGGSAFRSESTALQMKGTGVLIASLPALFTLASKPSVPVPQSNSSFEKLPLTQVPES